MRTFARLLAACAVSGASLLSPMSVRAQCMLADPSFELPGGTTAIAGWNQFGPVARVLRPSHGVSAAQVTGPNTGAFAVSAVWQNLVCTPGRQWTASVLVSHSAASPLTGQSKAILNIEWRNASGALISYESYTAADATTPAEAYRRFTVTSGAAPVGTASIHFLLGVLQGPTDPTPVVWFDEARCENLGPPTLASQQWVDFPGGRAVTFAGRSWRVKGPGFYGPGPNSFDNGVNAVSVDANGRLHLTIRKVGATWFSTEVVLEQALGYGDYVFTTRGRLDNFALSTVLGIFLWEYGACFNTAYLWWNPFNEIDIEWSRWGVAGNANAQFVAQPYDTPGNLTRFNVAFTDTTLMSHAMRWTGSKVDYRVWRGGPDAESPATRLASWTYSGPHLPRLESPRVHLNMWQFNGAPTTTQETVFENFTFRPGCPNGDCSVLAVDPPLPRFPQLTASPNPTRGLTRLHFSAWAAGEARLSVHDLAGRIVRVLQPGTLAEGPQELVWDGLDAQGRRVPAGLYLYRLTLAGRSESGRVIVVD